MKSRVKLQKGSKKLINAWAFYDWANSVYPLVISSTIFPIYYSAISDEISYVDFLGYQFKNTALISFVTAIAFLVVALKTPLLSGIADYIGNQKTFHENFCLYRFNLLYGPLFFELHNLYMGLFFTFLL